MINLINKNTKTAKVFNGLANEVNKLNNERLEKDALIHTYKRSDYIKNNIKKEIKKSLPAINQ